MGTGGRATPIGFRADVFVGRLARAVVSGACVAGAAWIVGAQNAARLLLDPPWWADGGVLAVAIGVLALVGFCSLYNLYRALFRASGASCPDCAADILGLPGGGRGYAACERCGRFTRQDGALLHHVPDDHVAQEAVFRVRLPDDAKIPSKCVVCGGAEARRLAVTWSYRSVQAGSRVPVEHAGSIALPYCGEHEGGASVTEFLGSSGPSLRVRSLAWARAMAEANGDTVGL